MTKWVCKWKPFWVPRGDTFQKAYLEKWEEEDDDQSDINGEESKNSHRSRSVSRTTAPENLHAVTDDGWSATREIPAPSGCPSLPQSSWQPFGDTNEPAKLWTHIETQESAVFWEPLGAPVPQKIRVRNFVHPLQFDIFPKRLSFPYPDAEILSGYEEGVSSTYTAPAPLNGRVDTSPAATYAASAPASGYVASAPAVAYFAPAPMIEPVAPAPAVTHATPAPVFENVAFAPAVTFSAPAQVNEPSIQHLPAPVRHQLG